MICGEGPHDVGRIAQWSIKTQSQVTQEGWLQPLLRKFSAADLEFEIVPRARLVKLPGPPKAPLPSGHGAKAYIAKFRAHSSECDVVVFMLDADTADDGEWKKKVAEVHEGFNLVDGTTIAIACVPKSTSESWLLADPEAWASLTPIAVSLPKSPETIWGKKADPASNHPHAIFAKACGQADLEDSTETRHALMEAATVASLKAACPLSFGRFSDEAIVLS
jgi:hypothetical protein